MKRKIVSVLLACVIASLTVGCQSEGTGNNNSGSNQNASQNTSTEKEESEKSEEQNSQGNSEENSEETNKKEVGKLVYLGEYDSYGSGYGNVIPVKKNNLWGLIDYDGNVIAQPTYTGYWAAANNDGYAILEDYDYYYIIGADGSIKKYERSNIDYIRIGDGNIVSYAKYGEEFEGDFIYEKLDGTLVYKAQNAVTMDASSTLTPFHEGKAYVYLNEDWESGRLVEIALDGTTKVIAKDPEDLGGASDYAIMPYGANADGYVVGTFPGWGGGTHLYHVNTGKLSGRLVGVKGSLLKDKDVDWESWYLENHIFADSFKLEDLERVCYDDYEFKTCYSNGTYTYNVENYGCFTVKLPNDTTCDILFDYLSVGDDEVITNYVAMYDRILFEDYKYLAVKDGDNWFYIDFKGNVVSDTYKDVTSFNSKGYALVMDKDGKAYVINDAFERLAELPYVTAMGSNGDIFVVECEFANGEKANGVYGYIYE